MTNPTRDDRPKPAKTVLVAVLAAVWLVLAALLPAAAVAAPAPPRSCTVDPSPGAPRLDLGVDGSRVAGVASSWWHQADAAVADWDGDGGADVLTVAGGRATVRFGSSSLVVTGLSSSPAAARLWDVTGDGVPDLVATGRGRVAVVVGGPSAVPAVDRTVELTGIGAVLPGWVAAAASVRNADGSTTSVPGDDGEVRPLWDLDGDGVADVGVFTPVPRSSGPWAYVVGRPCAELGPGQRSSPAAPRRDQGTIGRPPVLDADAPDPTIVYDAGWYHLYTTNVFTASGWVRVPHQRSRDLQHWEYVGDALAALPPWASTVGGFVWAPSVHRFGSTWAMFYVARIRPDAGLAANQMCVGRAVASSPDGPFVDATATPMLCQVFQGGSIDPDVHVAADGSPWLVFKNDGNCCGLPVSLWSWRLTSDGSAFTGALSRLLDADQPWERGVIEAPSMAEVGVATYLLYSGGDWQSSSYAVGVAGCPVPGGPCAKLSVASPWLGASAVAVGPGGQDVVADSNGDPWMAYHGWVGGVGYGNGGHRALYVERIRVGGFGIYLDPDTPYASAGPSVPGPPTGLGARPGFANVTLWWDQPPDRQGVPWQHQQITVRDRLGRVSFFVVEPDVEQWVIPFLADGDYTATVRVASDLGYGTESDPIAFTVSPAGARFHPVTPARLLDTRDGTGGVPAVPLGAGQAVRLPIAARAGLPPAGQVSAVTLSLTATGASTATHLTVWPGDIPDPPGTSSLNLGPGATVAKHVTAAVGGDGSVLVRNNSGSTDVVVDVTGWYGAPGALDGSLFRAAAPSRLLDTRDGTGLGVAGAVGPASTVRVPIAGRAGLPSDPAQVRAVVLNVTATGPTATTHIRAWPGGGAPPLASVVNADAGQTIADLVTVGVGDDGTVSLYNQSGEVDLVADLAGWFGPDGGTTGAVFHPLTPARIADSREGFGLPAPLEAGTPQTLPLNGHGGLPLFPAAAAVVATVTAVLPTADTHVTAYPRGPRPLASTLNLPGGTVLANEAAVATDNGYVSFETNSGATELVVDLMGWYRRVG